MTHVELDDVISTDRELTDRQVLSLAKVTVKEQESWMTPTDDLEKEMATIRRARQLAVNLNTFAMLRLARIEDLELWKQRKDADGYQLYGSFSAFLNAANEEINIAPATYYRGAAALGRAQQLGIETDTLVEHSPNTIDRVMREVTDKFIDAETKEERYDWKEDFQRVAKEHNKTPQELMQWILSEGRPISNLNTVMSKTARVVTHTIVTNRTFETPDFDGYFRQEIHINGKREMSFESDGATNQGVQVLIDSLNAQHMIDDSMGTGDRV